ncbi:MAG: FKBP-type peptidyl-prolyl cis-trans isomerase [Treponema sp.]|nr:FKBP-type peptidyl-prolyl cis-trans isomerase [Treponema sp.]
MKNFYFILIIALIFTGCNPGGKNPESEPSDFLNKDASYALGMETGFNFANDNTYIDVKAFTQGVKDALKGSTRFTDEQAYEILQQAFDTISNNRRERYMYAEREFLIENLEKPGLIITETGLRYEIIKEGNGPRPTENDVAMVEYTGKLINGNVFETSDIHSHPMAFPIYELFPGLAEGLKLMSVGSIHRIYIPSDLAYEEIGRGAQIPPYSTLIFDIELLSVQDTIPFFGYEPCCFFDFDNDDW